MEVGVAEVSDYLECAALISSAIGLESKRSSSDGFLLGSPSPEVLREHLDKRFVYTATEAGRIIGLVVAYPRGSRPFSELIPLIEQVEWIDKTVLTRTNLMYVDKKVVHPERRRRGVATALYAHLFSLFTGYCFLGVTVEKPILNQASQAFRQRHGFARVGEFKADEFEGIQGYQSGIYARDAKGPFCTR